MEDIYFIAYSGDRHVIIGDVISIQRRQLPCELGDFSKTRISGTTTVRSDSNFVDVDTDADTDIDTEILLASDIGRRIHRAWVMHNHSPIQSKIIIKIRIYTGITQYNKMVKPYRNSIPSSLL